MAHYQEMEGAHKRRTTQKRTSSTSKNLNSLLFSIFVGHFCLLDPDLHSKCGSGSSNSNGSRDAVLRIRDILVRIRIPGSTNGSGSGSSSGSTSTLLWEKGRIRSRIRNNDWCTRIREAQKHADPANPDPQHCGVGGGQGWENVTTLTTPLWRFNVGTFSYFSEGNSVIPPLDMKQYRYKNFDKSHPLILNYHEKVSGYNHL